MRPSSLYRSASVSSLSTSSSGSRRSTLDLASLLDAMGGAKSKHNQNESSLYNNKISITPDECDLYAGSFFSPPRPDRPITGPGDLFAGTDPNKQFVRFERSVFKLDRLLNMRHFNKLNSMPDRIDTADPANCIPAREIEDWLGNITESISREPVADSNKERRREQMVKMKVTDVMKKAMLVGLESAFLIEREVQESLIERCSKVPSSPSLSTPTTMAATTTTIATSNTEERVPVETVQTWDQVLSLVNSAKRPIPLFDSDSLHLLSSTQLAYLLESFGITKFSSRQPSHSSLVKSWLSVEVGVLKQLIGQGKSVLDDVGGGEGIVRVACVLSNTRRLDDLLRAIQNKSKIGKKVDEDDTLEGISTMNADKPDPICSTVIWTPELDGELLSYAEAFLRRRDHSTTAFTTWKSAYGPDLPERFTKTPNEAIWSLVARELRKGSRARISPNGCKRRYISVQRASL